MKLTTMVGNPMIFQATVPGWLESKRWGGGEKTLLTEMELAKDGIQIRKFNVAHEGTMPSAICDLPGYQGLLFRQHVQQLAAIVTYSLSMSPEGFGRRTERRSTGRFSTKCTAI